MICVDVLAGNLVGRTPQLRSSRYARSEAFRYELTRLAVRLECRRTREKVRRRLGLRLFVLVN